MSLRTDIHTTFDAIAPATGGMAERVVETARHEARDHKRRGSFMLQMRAPLSLVAVLVAGALMIGIAVGSQAIQTWDAQHSIAPAGDTYQSQVARLEARPLTLPLFTSYGNCISGPLNAAADLGSGPVFAQFPHAGAGPGGRWTTDSAVYSDGSIYTDTRIAGPILIRARDLFTNQPVFFVGQYAAGPTVGDDVMDGSRFEQRSELLLSVDDASHTPSTHRFHWEFLAGAPISWSGSTGWQIDATGFSEVFVAC